MSVQGVLNSYVDALKEILARGSEYWKKVMNWGKSRRLLSDKELSIIQMIVNMNYTGRIPTDKQAKEVIQARERLVKEGMLLMIF